MARFPNSELLKKYQLDSFLARLEALPADSTSERYHELLNRTKSALDSLKPETPYVSLYRGRYHLQCTKFDFNRAKKKEQLELAADAFASGVSLAKADDIEARSDLVLEIVPEFSLVLRQLAESAIDAQRLADATDWLVRTRELFQFLVVEYPSIPEFRRSLQESLIRLTRIYRRRGQFESAHEACALANELNSSVSVPDDSVTQLLGETLIDLGIWHRENGRYQDSRNAIHRAQSAFARGGQSMPTKSKQLLGQNLLVIGADQWFVGDSKGALETFLNSEKLFRELYESTSNDNSITELYATSHLAIGLSAALAENLDQAIASIEEAIKVYQSLYEESQTSTNLRLGLHTSHFLLAVCLERQGNEDKAVKVNQSQRQYEPLEADELFTLARAYANEAQMYGRGKSRFSDNDRFFVNRYHQQTIRLLKQSLESGLPDPDSIQQDPAFMPLYKYPDFRLALKKE